MSEPLHVLELEEAIITWRESGNARDVQGVSNDTHFLYMVVGANGRILIVYAKHMNGSACCSRFYSQLWQEYRFCVHDNVNFEVCDDM